MALVYLHRRLDNKEVFYVGIGKEEKRAYSNKQRTKYWYNVVNKYGYIVEITHRDIIWEEACVIEMYLISYYGRKDLELGQLVNMTDGGEGAYGRKMTEKTKQAFHSLEARRKAVANIDYSKIHTKETRIKMVASTDYKKKSENTNWKKIHTKEAHEKVRLLTDNFKHLKTSESRAKAASKRNYDEIVKKRSGKIDYSSILSKLNSPINRLKASKTRMKPVVQYSLTGEYIREWESATIADLTLNIERRNILACCKNRRKKAGGFIWKYKN